MSTPKPLEPDVLRTAAYVLAASRSTRTEAEVRAERAHRALIASGKLVILATRRKS